MGRPLVSVGTGDGHSLDAVGEDVGWHAGESESGQYSVETPTVE